MWDLSSRTRDRTHIPCIGRQILNHWTTREEVLVSLAVFCEKGLLHLLRPSSRIPDVQGPVRPTLPALKPSTLRMRIVQTFLPGVRVKGKGKKKPGVPCRPDP